jgi:hypothetical protein
MEIWANDEEAKPDRHLVDAFAVKEDCGILAETLAKKAVSSSFIGAVAGAFVTAEVLRALNSGVRCEYVKAHLRYSLEPDVIVKDESYAIRAASSGYCDVYSRSTSISSKIPTPPPSLLATV